MLMIRLSRVGKKKQPQYRLVVSEKRKDPWGDNLEILGFYDPLTDPKTFEFKKDRILHWISNGAQPSDTVHNLLVKAGVIDAKKKRATKGDIKKRLDAAKEAEAKAKEASAAAKAEADNKEKEAESAAAESEAEAPVEGGEAPEAAPDAEAPVAEEKKEEASAEAEEKKESTDAADKEEEKKA